MPPQLIALTVDAVMCAARADAVTTTTTIASITKVALTMTMTSDVAKPKKFQGRVSKSPRLCCYGCAMPCAIKNSLSNWRPS